MRLRRCAAKTLENIPHQRGWIFLHLLFHGREIGRFAREEMSFGNDSEIIRRVLQLHQVSLFPLEIDQDLVEQEIPFRHAAEAPAFVQTKSAGL